MMTPNDEIVHPNRPEHIYVIPVPRIIKVKEMPKTIDPIRTHDSSGNELNDGARLPNSNDCEMNSIPRSEQLVEDSKYWLSGIWSGISISGCQKIIFKLPFTLFLYVTSLSLIFLLPYHDVIKFSNYWYEILVPAIFGYISGLSLLVLLQVSKLLNDDSILNLELLFMLFTIPAAAITIFHAYVYFIWSVCLGYNSPMPFIVLILLIPWLISFGCVFWYYFTHKYLGDVTSAVSKLILYCLYMFTTCTSVMSCLVIFGMYLTMNKYFQWISVILLAVSRKVFGGWMCKVICKASVPGKTLIVKGISYIQEAILYKSFIMSIFSINSDQILGYFVLAVPFFMNLYICIKVIKLHGQVTNNDHEEENLLLRKDELLMKLIINEITELLVPIIFIISFMFAYYGPNAAIIGNVQNDYWQYHRIEDPFSYVSGILLMTVIDFSGATISLILVWGLCKINCWSFIKENVVELFNIMALDIIFAINGVSISK